MGTKYTTQRNEFLQFLEVCFFQEDDIDDSMCWQLFWYDAKKCPDDHKIALVCKMLDCYIADVDC